MYVLLKTIKQFPINFLKFYLFRNSLSMVANQIKENQIKSSHKSKKVLSPKYFSLPTTFDPAITLRKKCLYSEFFWSPFSRIQTQYGDLQSKFTFSVQMRENADQKSFEYGHFSRSVTRKFKFKRLLFSLMQLLDSFT